MFIKKYLDLMLEERRKHLTNRNPKIIWVSELVACKEKFLFTRIYPEVFTFEPRMILEQIVHKGVQEFLRDNFDYNVEVEATKVVDKYLINGRIDALNDEEVVEIKYVQDIFQNEPYEHHVMQTGLYMWLTDRERGTIVYISPKRMIEFEVQGKLSDDDVLMLIDTWASPRFPWECSYCYFNCICNKAAIKKREMR